MFNKLLKEIGELTSSLEINMENLCSEFKQMNFTMYHLRKEITNNENRDSEIVEEIKKEIKRFEERIEEQFKTGWGGLLGGRQKHIERLREELEYYKEKKWFVVVTKTRDGHVLERHTIGPLVPSFLKKSLFCDDKYKKSI